MIKIKQTDENLKKYLSEELELLQFLCDSYDNGKTLVDKQMATVIRRLARTVLAKVVLANVKYLSDKWCREIKEDPYYNEKYI